MASARWEWLTRASALPAPIPALVSGIYHHVQVASPSKSPGSLHRTRIRADANAKSFQGRIKQASGSEFGPTISFKNSRSILFKGLTAGISYMIELCAIGGSTGQSDWSEPATKMAQ